MEPRTIAAKMRIAVVLALAAWAAVTLPRPAATHAADPFTSNLTYSANFSSTLAGSSPTITTTIGEDCPLGPAACPATSSMPMPDVLALQYSSNIVSCTASKPLPCNGDVPFDATVGTVQLHANTNVVTAYGADNVNPTTGAPAACGAAGTTPLTTTFTLYNARVTPGSGVPIVSSLDGADPDNLPDTQADNISPAASGANGIPDGADGIPEYIATYISDHHWAPTPNQIASRAYGVVQVTPGSAQVDVNIVTLDVTLWGGGYAALIFFGDPRAMHLPDPNVNQSVQLCTPFAMTLTQPGVSGDSFGSSWTANGVTTTHSSHETPTPVRAITGAPTDPIHYALEASSAEDADGDGTQPIYDRCPNADVGAFPSGNGLTASTGTQDSDGDGIGDSCDPDPFSADNCPGTAFPGKSGTCNTARSGGPNIGTTYPTHQTWDPDQDIDGDTFPNWADNCPTVYNLSQLDTNGDGIGDACQAKPYAPFNPLPSLASIPAVRCAPDCPIRPANDHDDFCDAMTSVGGAAPTTTCYVRDGVTPIAGNIRDSDDDGFPDYLVVPGFSFTDKNSDADWDGCPDYTEVHSPPGAPCGGGDPRLPNSNPATACITVITIKGLFGAGSNVSYTVNTLTDSNQSLVPNVLVGMQVNAGGSYGIVASNTSTQITLTANWTPLRPIPGAAYVAGPCVDGNKDQNGNGIPDWKDVATDSTQQDIPATSNPNGGDADSDWDGCTNRREALNTAINNAAGGGRDGVNPWDYYDVFTVRFGLVSKDHAVAIADTIATMQYVGTSVAKPDTPNSNGKTYAGLTPDGSPGFETYDRSAVVAKPDSGPPDGAISIADALINLNQIGANCSTL